MNICFVSTCQFNPTTGGIDRVSVTLIEEFQRLGHSVYCVFLKSSVDKIDNIGGQFLLPEASFGSEESIAYATNLILDNNIDILINQSYSNDSILYCSKLRETTRVKVINTLHFAPLWLTDAVRDNTQTIHYTSPNSIKGRVKQLYHYLKQPITLRLRYRSQRRQYREAYKGCDAYVLLSDSFRQSFCSIVGDADFSKLYTITNSISIENCNIDFSAKKNQILYVGRLVYSKRVDRLLKIWKYAQPLLLNWDLVIVGEGEDLESLKILSNKLNLTNISFEGRRNPRDYYIDSKILCLTSSSLEGFALVLPEAQSYGCVPVAFDSFASVHDIIDDGENGVLVTPYNYKIYAKKLVELCDNESRREMMAKKGLETIEKFNVKNVVPQWIELFEKLT